jgi:hypothetical protein
MQVQQQRRSVVTIDFLFLQVSLGHILNRVYYFSKPKNSVYKTVGPKRTFWKLPFLAKPCHPEALNPFRYLHFAVDASDIENDKHEKYDQLLLGLIFSCQCEFRL